MGIKWSVLEGEDENNLVQVSTVNDADKPSYPSSSKKVNINKIYKLI